MPEYDTITVSSGDTFSKDMSSGETWENKLIDITASGAGYSITNGGGSFTMRNIGIRGSWDHDPGSQAIVLDLEAGETGLVENIYLGDGAEGGGDPGGAYVHNKHEGEITFRRMNIQGFPDNGIYASGPGLPDDGGQGVVRMENIYAANCGSSGVRIGSHGSYVENCVAWDCDRGLWCLFSSDLEARGSDFGQSTYDIRVGSGSQESGGPYGELAVSDTRWDTQQLERSQNEIHGSNGGAPRRSEPDEVEGVPLSAEEAASGTSSGEDDVAFGVTTGPVEDVTDTGATLTGSLDGLGEHDAADVHFEYRQVDES